MYYTILNKLIFAQIKWLLAKPSYGHLTWVKTENYNVIIILVVMYYTILNELMFAQIKWL